jgi:hypothetical protein
MVRSREREAKYHADGRDAAQLLMTMVDFLFGEQNQWEFRVIRKHGCEKCESRLHIAIHISFHNFGSMLGDCSGGDHDKTPNRLIETGNGGQGKHRHRYIKGNKKLETVVLIRIMWPVQPSSAETKSFSLEKSAREFL